MTGGFADSLWAATAPPAPATQPLAGDVRTAVAVIGGGFTGLSAALHLAEAGVPVTLLESHAIGWGASGRNNGQVIPTLSRIDPDDIVAKTPAELGGAEKGEQLVALIRDSATLVFDLIRRHGIEAEAVQNGWIQPAHRESRLRLSSARATQWARRGAPVQVYGRAEMAALTGSDFWHGGWGNPTGGRINPLGFARGLAAAAIRAGATLHTGSPARTIAPAPGGGWRIGTPGGTLTAERVIIGTQAYTDGLWPGLRRTIVPVRSYQMATAPLPAAIGATIIPGGQALSDTQNDLHFFRFDQAGRLVTGGALILPLAWDARLRRRIGARLLRVFPQIGEVRFEHLWWGYIAATEDRLPHLYDLAPGVLAWTGCNGRGVGLAVALGREMARASGGTPLRDIAAPVETRLREIAGHAFRALGIGWNIAAARRIDARD